MSGGSYGYSYHLVEEMAYSLLKDKEPYRKAFGEHLLLIANAMHDIEWVDSCDKSPGDEKEAIMKCINQLDIGHKLVEDAQKVLEELQSWIYEVKGVA